MYKSLISSITLCGFSLFYFGTSGYGQGKLTNRFLNDTTSFLPKHFTERVNTFQGEPVVRGRVLFLGNSITEGGNWG